MENEKIKTDEYQPVEKLNLAKNLGKFTILKLCNKHSTYKKLAVQCSSDTFVQADYFHSYGNPYLGNSKYSGIWFRIGNESSDRYLHVGSVSLGCVSVGKSSAADSTPEFEKWSNLYIYLSKKRSGNKFIGEIIVS